MQYQRKWPERAEENGLKSTRVGARKQNARLFARNRWPVAVTIAACIAALTPVLAFAAAQPSRTGLALSVAWIAFVAMMAVVVAMWRHFARQMLASLRPRWEDWG